MWAALQYYQFLDGLQHAFDSDHLAIVAEYDRAVAATHSEF